MKADRSRTIFCFVTTLLSALLNSHRLCEGLCISRLFLLTFFRPPRESGFWFFAEIIKPSNVIGRLKMCRLSSIYHPVRCQNRDSSWILYFHSSVIQIINLRASADEVIPYLQRFFCFFESLPQKQQPVDTEIWVNNNLKNEICRVGFSFFLYFVLTIFLHSLRSSNNLKRSFLTPPTADF